MAIKAGKTIYDSISGEVYSWGFIGDLLPADWKNKLKDAISGLSEDEKKAMQKLYGNKFPKQLIMQLSSGITGDVVFPLDTDGIAVDIVFPLNTDDLAIQTLIKLLNTITNGII